MIKIEINDDNIINITEFNNEIELKEYLKKHYDILDEWDYNHLINFGYCENATFNFGIKIIPTK